MPTDADVLRDPEHVLVPFKVWSEEVDQFCAERCIFLAAPWHSVPFVHNSSGDRIGHTLVRGLVRQQEVWYGRVYQDTSFLFDYDFLALPRWRIEDIKQALERGEVNYPLVVASPRCLAECECGHTLIRVLFDRLIRGGGIRFWDSELPNVNAFFEHVRDVTLADLARTYIRDADGTVCRFGRDRFKSDSPRQPWFRFLCALYPTLPRIAADVARPTIAFVAWEQHPSAERMIPGMTHIDLRMLDPDETPTIGVAGKNLFTAVRYRYPLVALAQYLVLFRQHYDTEGGAGHELDGATCSLLFAVLDPQQASDRPCVRVGWTGADLYLSRILPGYVHEHSRLRVSR
ncbi:MAG: hypothetical protein Q7T01_01870 [bacterium]|nr:hypothetical protein [bacterium]